MIIDLRRRTQKRIGFGNMLLTTEIQHVYKLKANLGSKQQCFFLTFKNGLIINNVYQL